MFIRRMPELSEDEKEGIEHVLIHSYKTRYPITIKLFTYLSDVTTGVYQQSWSAGVRLSSILTAITNGLALMPY